MKLTNTQKREIVRTDYNAIANEYAESYSQMIIAKNMLMTLLKR